MDWAQLLFRSPKPRGAACSKSSALRDRSLDRGADAAGAASARQMTINPEATTAERLGHPVRTGLPRRGGGRSSVERTRLTGRGRLIFYRRHGAIVKKKAGLRRSRR